MKTRYVQHFLYILCALSASISAMDLSLLEPSRRRAKPCEESVYVIDETISDDDLNTEMKKLAEKISSMNKEYAQQKTIYTSHHTDHETAKACLERLKINTDNKKNYLRVPMHQRGNTHADWQVTLKNAKENKKSAALKMRNIKQELKKWETKQAAYCTLLAKRKPEIPSDRQQPARIPTFQKFQERQREAEQAAATAPPSTTCTIL